MRAKKLLSKTITVTLNGETYSIKRFKKISLYHFIVFLGYQFSLIAIEYNNTIITESSSKTLWLKNNSQIEIVTIVGGG